MVITMMAMMIQQARIEGADLCCRPGVKKKTTNESNLERSRPCEVDGGRSGLGGGGRVG